MQCNIRRRMIWVIFKCTKLHRTFCHFSTPRGLLWGLLRALSTPRGLLRALFRPQGAFFGQCFYPEGPSSDTVSTPRSLLQAMFLPRGAFFRQCFDLEGPSSGNVSTPRSLLQAIQCWTQNRTFVSSIVLSEEGPLKSKHWKFGAFEDCSGCSFTNIYA